MKKYMSVILIPILLLQFFGCYSPKEISIEELSNFEEATITTKDSTKYHLKKYINDNHLYNNPGDYFYNDWLIHPDTQMIGLISKVAHKERKTNATEWTVIKDTSNINFKDIANISIEELDGGNTAWVVIASIVGVVGIAVAIIAATFSFNMNF